MNMFEADIPLHAYIVGGVDVSCEGGRDEPGDGADGLATAAGDRYR